jgi:hypothetical protein
MSERVRKMFAAVLLMAGGAALFAGAAMRDDPIDEDGRVRESSPGDVAGVAVFGALLALPLLRFYTPGGPRRPAEPGRPPGGAR